jgi:Holliday junction resolvasome RuvABC DNA-binding subunit
MMVNFPIYCSIIGCLHPIIEQTVVTYIHQEDIERLDSIPGIANRRTEKILAEVGTHVEKQFPVWLTCAPGQY